MYIPFNRSINFVERLHESILDNREFRNPLGFYFDEEVYGSEVNPALAILGSPGVGKTSISLSGLKMIPQVVFHVGKFKGVLFLSIEIRWVYVTCPPDASKSVFAEQFYKELDRLLPHTLSLIHI